MVTATVTVTAMDTERTKNKRMLTIAVDFDGTIVEHKYPSIGREKPFAMDVLRQLAADGHRLILWTAREGKLLEEALAYCEKRGVSFYAANSNHPAGYLFEETSSGPSKIVADVYIDDHNLGGLPDWSEIYTMLSGGVYPKKRKKPWWKRIFRRRRH